jgi:hypothetical protein
MNRRLSFRGLFVIAIFLMTAGLRADPENFVVDGFTFVRPASWKWVWDEKRSKKGNLLEVGATNSTELADVYIWKFPKEEGNVENRTKAWNAYFKELPEDLHTKSSNQKVGAFDVTFIEIEGTYCRPPYPDHALVGAIIKRKDGHLVLRMSGRSKVVEEAQPALKKMVEQALTDRDSD